MQRTWRRGVVFLAVILIRLTLGREVAFAAFDDKVWEVGGYTGESTFANSSNIGDALVWGARGAYYIKAAHGIELDLDFGSAGTTGRGNVDFDLAKIGVNYIHNLQLKGREKAVPLVLFGVGRITVDNGTSDASSTVLRAGGGVRYFYTPRLSLRVDGRIYHWRGDGEVNAREGYFSFDLTVGLSVLLGAAK